MGRVTELEQVKAALCNHKPLLSGWDSSAGFSGTFVNASTSNGSAIMTRNNWRVWLRTNPSCANLRESGVSRLRLTGFQFPSRLPCCPPPLLPASR